MAGESGNTADDDDDLNKLFAENAADPEMSATLAAQSLGGSLEDDDLEAQMAAAMAMEAGGSDDDDLERQMSIAMRDDSGRGPRGGRGSFMDALSDDDRDSGPAVQPLRFQQLRPSEEHVSSSDIARLMDVSLNVSVELGRKQMQIKEILELGPGKIIELEKLAGEPVDLLVNGKLLARGEVVVVDENFGVRITELVDPKDRIKML